MRAWDRVEQQQQQQQRTCIACTTYYVRTCTHDDALDRALQLEGE